MAAEPGLIRKIFAPAVAAQIEGLVAREAIDVYSVKSETLPPPEQPVLLLCPERTSTIGARQVKCRCGKFVWTSPHSQLVMAAHTHVRVICLDCFLKEQTEATNAKA